jgi:hypothetical protein
MTNEFAKSRCISCRMDHAFQRCTGSPFDNHISCSRCHITEHSVDWCDWTFMTLCEPNCKICQQTEIISYKEKPFDCNFPDLTLKCLDCKSYCRYVYCNKGVTIQSVSLEYIHITAKTLNKKVCCLIKPPFPYRNADRACAECVRKTFSTSHQ